MALLHISIHPVVQDKVTQLRDKTISTNRFWRLLEEITQFLAYEALADLETEFAEVETPLAKAQGRRLSEKIGLFPILRAGLGMVNPFRSMMPTARVWHIGMYRNEQTREPVWYYNKVPPQPKSDVCYVLDPMLATGGTACAAVDFLTKWGARRISYVGIIAAPEGVKALSSAFPDVPIHIGALDDHLNDAAYIVPGLGDAGDRMFGTCVEEPAEN
ncbi:MAG: uracil phosphoribosyltransferase [Patescibacteria group bacterium]